MPKFLVDAAIVRPEDTDWMIGGIGSGHEFNISQAIEGDMSETPPAQPRDAIEIVRPIDRLSGAGGRLELSTLRNPAHAWPTLPRGCRPIGMKRLSLQGYASTATGGEFNPKTYSSLHQLPLNAVGVQFELANVDLTDSHVNAAYALSSGMNDWVTPLNASGAPDNSLWIPVTLGGSTTMTVPASPVPGGIRPGRALTDAMYFESTPPSRIDGGSGALLFFRVCSSDSTTLTYHYASGAVGTWDGQPNMQCPAQYSETWAGGIVFPGVNAAVSGGFAQSGSRATCIVPHSVLPITSGPALTLMSVGDSIISGESVQNTSLDPTYGVTVDGGADALGLQAAKMLNTIARPVYHVCEAKSGMVSSDFIANATATLVEFVPDVILLQTFSTNDSLTPTDDSVRTQFEHCVGFAKAAAAAGSAVIGVCSPPFVGSAPAASALNLEARRLFANALLRGSGIPFIDWDVLIGTGSDPVNFRTGTTTDHAHINFHGQKVGALAAIKIMQTYYGIY